MSENTPPYNCKTKDARAQIIANEESVLFCKNLAVKALLRLRDFTRVSEDK